MIIIRTAEDMARALDAPLAPDLNKCLQGHRDRLSEWTDYELSELATFVIIQPHDTLADAEIATGWKLVGEGCFTNPPDIVTRHRGWIEATFILSDDGFGLVLLVSTEAGGADELLAACNQRL